MVWDWTRIKMLHNQPFGGTQGLEAPDGRTIQRCDRGVVSFKLDCDIWPSIQRESWKERDILALVLGGGPSFSAPYANDTSPSSSAGSNRQEENGQNQHGRGSRRELVATNGGG
jgi:hypothetical protein